jgi:DNA-binding NarL/FixJ family response regulator
MLIRSAFIARVRPLANALRGLQTPPAVLEMPPGGIDRNATTEADEVVRSRPGAKSRIMIVDDHALVRDAVQRALGAAEFDVVAEASSAQEALDRVGQARPDVILLDIDLRGTSGLDVLPELKRRAPRARIVMLTVSADGDDVDDAIRRGATGYLTKDMSSEALTRAIRGAIAGDLAMSRRMAQQVVDRYAKSSTTESDGKTLAGLTTREREILRLLSDGRTAREIGDVLVLSPRTVEGHVGKILHKLDVRNRVEAVRLFRGL